MHSLSAVVQQFALFEVFLRAVAPPFGNFLVSDLSRFQRGSLVVRTAASILILMVSAHGFCLRLKKYILYIYVLETSDALVNWQAESEKVRVWNYSPYDRPLDMQAREPTSANGSALSGECGQPKK